MGACIYGVEKTAQNCYLPIYSPFETNKKRGDATARVRVRVDNFLRREVGY